LCRYGTAMTVTENASESPWPPPTVGRIVHYEPEESQKFRSVGPIAAIVTSVMSNSKLGTVNLRAFPDSALDTMTGDDRFTRLANVPYSELAKPGHWSYPPRA